MVACTEGSSTFILVWIRQSLLGNMSPKLSWSLSTKVLGHGLEGCFLAGRPGWSGQSALWWQRLSAPTCLAQLVEPGVQVSGTGYEIRVWGWLREFRRNLQGGIELLAMGKVNTSRGMKHPLCYNELVFFLIGASSLGNTGEQFRTA